MCFLNILSFLLTSLPPTTGLHPTCSAPLPSPPNTIHVIVLLPSSSFYLASLPRVLPAIRLAVDRTAHLLPGHAFDIATVDTGCNVAYGIWRSIEAYIERPAHLFLGPSCDYVLAPVSRLMKFVHIPLLTAGALAYDFGEDDRRDPKAEYNMLVRTGWIFRGMGHALERTFDRYGWRRVRILYDSNARREVMSLDYCKLAVQALIKVTKENRTCVAEPYKLSPNITKKELMDTMVNQIGVKFAVRHDVTERWRSKPYDLCISTGKTEPKIAKKQGRSC